MSQQNAVAKLVPDSLEAQRVPLNVIAITAAVSVVAMLYGASLADSGDLIGRELWKPVLFGLIPWLPIFFFEAVWKYENYGFYALLGLFTLLQVGHLGEHAVQVMQLWISGGKPSVSHGVFGVFDTELVHFVWDSLVWIGLLGLVIKLGTHNRWLIVAMIAASFHEVEHVFLTYLYLIETPFYEMGGTTGILAKGGLIGSPLPRPYLHFTYNFVVVFPLLIAFWDETKRAYNLFLARALPSLTSSEKASATGMLQKVSYEAGETIIRQGDRADRFYVVGEGEVEVIRESDEGEERLAILNEGHFFGEIGLLTGRPRTATVRAHTDVDIFVLEADEFLGLLTRSTGAQADIDSEVLERLENLHARNVDIRDIVVEQPVPDQRAGANGRTSAGKGKDA